MSDKSNCAFEKCELPVKARGLCSGHYQQQIKGRELVPLRLPAIRGFCFVDSCDRLIAYNGLCNTHNNQKKAGKPFSDIRTWKRADWYNNGHGYMVRSKMTNGVKVTELQHRVVMEEHLGRKLFPEESVHHKNGIRHDNRIENLELWVKSQPAGQRAEDLLEWQNKSLPDTDQRKRKYSG